MFENLGPMELMVILLLVLLFFGAKRLPEVGASLGKGIREFKRSINEVSREIDPADRPLPPRREPAARDLAQEEPREPRRLLGASAADESLTKD